MRKKSVEYTDDLDGQPIDDALAQTIRFTVDGIDYEIDLRPAHAEQFRAQMARWITAATRTETLQAHGRRQKDHPARDPVPPPRSVAARDRYQLAAVRDWARGQGIEVSSRGRVPQWVLERFDAAHAR